MVHRVTTSDNRWYNEWQWMATSGNEWERVVQRMKANANDFMFQNATMMQCKTTIYSAMLFWKCNVKQNICRSSHRRCSIKKQLLLTILEYSQGNTWRPATLSKRYSNTSVFQWILRNFLERTYFEEHLRTAASASIFNNNKKCFCGSKTLHKTDLENRWIGQVLFK